MSEPNLYVRGRTWWARARVNNRSYRFSLRTQNVDVAKKALAQWLDSCRARVADQQWASVVENWEADRDSWLSRTMRHMRSRSRKKGWERCMGYDEFVNLVLLSNGKCALTGIPFELDSRGGHEPFAISIDRIDCARGYETDNCRIVCIMANIAMRHWGEEALMRLSIGYLTTSMVRTSAGTRKLGVAAHKSHEMPIKQGMPAEGVEPPTPSLRIIPFSGRRK